MGFTKSMSIMSYTKGTRFTKSMSKGTTLVVPKRPQ